MEKTNFDQLLQRYLSGKVSEEERTKIEAWLEEKKVEGADIDLSKEEEEKIFLRITGKLGQGTSRGRARQVPFTRWAIGIAATLLIAVTVSYLFYVGNDAARPETEKMILNDGSIVWLRGQSKLVYFEKSRENIRYAEFSGEALFEVSKNANKPFEIHCGDMTIRVVGTSFSLKSMNDSLELEVLTGKVHISSSKEKEGVDVESNQKVIYTGKGELVSIPMKAADVSALIASTEYDMQFTNTTMDEVLARVRKKFNVKIKLDNPQAGACRLTGDFTDHSLESTLHMMTEVLEVEYTIQDNVITITGNGCK